ncbi:HNH endonuclease signature motif containing protein, partial [Angustibacter peucedani]
SSHGSAYRVIVTVDAATFAAALNGEVQPGLLPAELPDGQPLSAAALAEISCSAEMVPVLFDQVGNPLDVGRTQYPFPAKQRLAIAVRDKHCTFPGCTAPPAWCDVHHTTPFSRGGKTSVSTGTLVCGRHHRHVHTTGMTAHLVDGQIVWSTDPPDRTTEDGSTSAAVDDLVRRFLARLRRSSP